MPKTRQDSSLRLLHDNNLQKSPTWSQSGPQGTSLIPQMTHPEVSVFSFGVPLGFFGVLGGTRVTKMNPTALKMEPGRCQKCTLGDTGACKKSPCGLFLFLFLLLFLFLFLFLLPFLLLVLFFFLCCFLVLFFVVFLISLSPFSFWFSFSGSVSWSGSWSGTVAGLPAGLLDIYIYIYIYIPGLLAEVYQYPYWSHPENVHIHTHTHTHTQFSQIF